MKFQQRRFKTNRIQAQRVRFHSEEHSSKSFSICIFERNFSYFSIMCLSVLPKTVNLGRTISQPPNRLNNELPTELDDKFLENMETSTEEIQNQLNKETMG